MYLYPSLSASGAFHPRSNVFWEGLGRIFRSFPSRLHSQSHAFYVGANPAASFCKIRHATPSVPTQSARAKHFTRIHTRKHTNISMWHILSSVLSRLHRKRVTRLHFPDSRSVLACSNKKTNPNFFSFLLKLNVCCRFSFSFILR